MLRPTLRLFLLLLALPGVAAAGGTAGVLPFVAGNGVDARAVENITAIVSTEVDIKGGYEFVMTVKAEEAKAGCSADPACAAQFGRTKKMGQVVGGRVDADGADRFKVMTQIVDVATGKVVKQASRSMARKADVLIEEIPDFVTELITGKSSRQAAAEVQAKKEQDQAALANIDMDELMGEDEPKAAKGAKGAKDSKGKGKAKGKAEEDDQPEWAKLDSNGRPKGPRKEVEEEPDPFGGGAEEEEVDLDHFSADKIKKEQAERATKDAARRAEEDRQRAIAAEADRKRQEEVDRKKAEAARVAELERQARLEEQRAATARADERRRRDEEERREADAERSRKEEAAARVERERAREAEARASAERQRREEDAEEARSVEADRKAQASRRAEEDRRARADAEERRARTQEDERRSRPQPDERRAERPAPEEPAQDVELVSAVSLGSGLIMIGEGEDEEDEGAGEGKDEDPGFTISTGDDEEEDSEEEPVRPAPKKDNLREGQVIGDDEAGGARGRKSTEARRSREEDSGDRYARARKFGGPEDEAAQRESGKRSPKRESQPDAEVARPPRGDGGTDRSARRRSTEDEDDRIASREQSPRRQARDEDPVDDDEDPDGRIDEDDINLDDISDRSASRESRGKLTSSAAADVSHLSIRAGAGYAMFYYPALLQWGIDVGIFPHKNVSIDLVVDFWSYWTRQTSADGSASYEASSVPSFMVGASFRGSKGIVRPYVGGGLSIVYVQGPVENENGNFPQPLVGVGGGIRGGADFMFTRVFGLTAGLKLGVVHSADIAARIPNPDTEWKPLGFFFSGGAGAILRF